MSNFNNTDIRRLEDGSIDYGYYVRLGHEARSREFNAVSNHVFELPSRILAMLSIAVTAVCGQPDEAGSLAQDDTSG